MDWNERIMLDPTIMIGKPVIRGTRITVELIIDLMADGWTSGQILVNYPQLSEADLKAALYYASEFLKTQRAYPLPV